LIDPFPRTITGCNVPGASNLAQRGILFLLHQNINHLFSTNKFDLSTTSPIYANLVLEKKLKVVLIVDEASLMRLEVFAELHTICQFEKDSKPYLPMILAGQNNLIDKLSYRSCQPLASRIVARSHLQAISLDGMKTYLEHHLVIAGVEHNLFDQTALTTIHQGSGGLFRKANHLARGSLIAAAANNKSMVDAEHVQLAATEIF
jgi:type II secretory pathway predicted ATPase ExeA